MQPKTIESHDYMAGDLDLVLETVEIYTIST